MDRRGLNKQEMDIETYSEKHVHFLTGEIPALLEDYLRDAVFDNLLDLGCGDGALLHALKQQGYLEDTVVFAVDVSPLRVDTTGKIDSGFRTYVCDACDIDCLGESSVDFLVSNQVIEHVSDDRAMASEMGRVLRPGGLAYVSTIYKKWYGWYFYRCNGRWALDPTHVREYTDNRQLPLIIEDYEMVVLEERKSQIRFPLVDFITRRLGGKLDVYDRKRLSSLRKFKIPIPGYYYWELMCQKKSI